MNTKKKVLTYTEKKRVEEISVMTAIMSMLVVEAHEEMNDIQASVGIVPTKMMQDYFEGIKYFAEINNLHITADFKESTAKQELENAMLYHVRKLLKKADTVVNKKRASNKKVAIAYRGNSPKKYNVFNSNIFKNTLK